MRKTIIYIACSLNGKIAKLDGSVEWLESIPNPEKTDYGYTKFYKSIDTTIQGFKTYKQIIDWGIEFPYSDKKNYVFTRQEGLKNTENVDFISDQHVRFIQQLKEQEGKDIWVIGGGQINSLLLKENLIDELQVFIMPIIITDGIDLVGSLTNDIKLELIDSKSYSNGTSELRYRPVYS